MLADAERRAYEANLRKFYLFRFLVDFQLWLPIWVIYLREERGLSLTQITALDAPFWLVLVLAEVPTGVVADRFGRKVSLAYGAGINAVAIFIFAIADSYPLLLSSYLLWGVAWTLFSGADAAFFFDSLKALGRQDEFQKLWGRARSVQSFGALLGILLGAPLAAATSLWFPVLMGAIFLGGACLVSLTFREPPVLDEEEEQLSYIQGTKVAARLAFGNPSIRYMMLLAAVVMSVAMGMAILSQPFLARHDIDVANFGWFLMPGSLAGIAAAMFVYRISDAFGVRQVIAAMPVIVMVAAVGLGSWDSIGAFIFLPLGAMVFSMGFPVISNYLNQRIPSSRRATILSFYQLLFSVLLAALEPTLGFIGEHAGLPVAYRTAGIILAVGSTPLLALWLRANRAERLVAEPVAPALTVEPAAD
jgi:MFS family permease